MPAIPPWALLPAFSHTALPENIQMLNLGRKLGFTLKRDKESGDYVLSLDLNKQISEHSIKGG